MGLLFCFIAGLLIAALAHHKGRNPIGWFFIGFFFHIFGLVVLLVASNKREEKAKFDQIENDNRRLHEQLRQERLKNEQFRKHTQARLDVHDETLGLDTKTAATPALEAGDLQKLDDVGDTSHPVYDSIEHTTNINDTPSIAGNDFQSDQPENNISGIQADKRSDNPVINDLINGNLNTEFDDMPGMDSLNDEDMEIK